LLRYGFCPRYKDLETFKPALKHIPPQLRAIAAVIYFQMRAKAASIFAKTKSALVAQYSSRTQQHAQASYRGRSSKKVAGLQAAA
jgi:hypothetical protein